MFELIAAGVVGVMSHLSSRDFVRRRLRYTDWVDRPGLGLAAGVVATGIATPVVAVLPIVGGLTAIVFGAAVGTGVSVGARQTKRGYLLED
jgi:hypothetical protein